MAVIRRFEEIISWQEARKLNQVIRNIIESGNFQRNFELIRQIEGSAGSIMDNIAEGFERSGNKEFLQFLYIAKGSCGELRSQMYRAIDCNYITADQFDLITKQTYQISSLIQKLINYINQSEFKGSKFKSSISSKVP